ARPAALSRPANEQEANRRHDTEESGQMTPMERLAEHEHHEAAENDQRDRLLRDLELSGRPAASIADAVRRHCQAIFDEGDRPADQDDEEKRLIHAAFQM